MVARLHVASPPNYEYYVFFILRLCSFAMLPGISLALQRYILYLLELTLGLWCVLQLQTFQQHSGYRLRIFASSIPNTMYSSSRCFIALALTGLLVTNTPVHCVHYVFFTPRPASIVYILTLDLPALQLLASLRVYRCRSAPHPGVLRCAIACSLLPGAFDRRFRLTSNDARTSPPSNPVLVPRHVDCDSGSFLCSLAVSPSQSPAESAAPPAHTARYRASPLPGSTMPLTPFALVCDARCTS